MSEFPQNYSIDDLEIDDQPLTHNNTANMSTAEFGQGTDSESDTTTSSEIVEVSELEKFCETFRRAQELAVVAAQKLVCLRKYTRKSKRTLRRHKQQWKCARLEGAHLITDFFKAQTLMS